MGPKAASSKRKAANDDDGPAQGKPARGQRYAACVPFVELQKSREGEQSIVPQTVNQAAWQRTLALHLAATPHFVRHYIENKGDPSHYIIRPEFLAQVYLRGRYRTYEGFAVNEISR